MTWSRCSVRVNTQLQAENQKISICERDYKILQTIKNTSTCSLPESIQYRARYIQTKDDDESLLYIHVTTDSMISHLVGEEVQLLCCAY